MSVAEPAATACLGEGTEAVGCHLRHVVAGRDCRLIHSVVTGCADNPVVLGDRVTLVNCHVQVAEPVNAFDFAGWGVNPRATRLGDDVWFSHSTLLNTLVEAGSRGVHAALESSHVGPRNDLRTFTNMTRSRTAADCNLGSEVSKTLILGDGFVSEHANTYLSLLAPADYPIHYRGRTRRGARRAPEPHEHRRRHRLLQLRRRAVAGIGGGAQSRQRQGHRRRLHVLRLHQQPGGQPHRPAAGPARPVRAAAPPRPDHSGLRQLCREQGHRPHPGVRLRRRPVAPLPPARLGAGQETRHRPQLRHQNAPPARRPVVAPARPRRRGPCASNAGSSRTSSPAAVPASTPASSCRTGWPSCSPSSRTAGGP